MSDMIISLCKTIRYWEASKEIHLHNSYSQKLQKQQSTHILVCWELSRTTFPESMINNESPKNYETFHCIISVIIVKLFVHYEVIVSCACALFMYLTSELLGSFIFFTKIVLFSVFEAFLNEKLFKTFLQQNSM